MAQSDREFLRLISRMLVAFGLIAAAYFAAGGKARADDDDGGMRAFIAAPQAAPHRPGIGARPRNRALFRAHMLAGVDATLAAKAREIAATCGARVVSGVRHTYVAGTRRLSLHASGRAVDMAGNPACIYRMLAGWPGGYSTDYGSARHVHFSLHGREDGLRFAHHFGRSRYAARRIRYAWR